MDSAVRLRRMGHLLAEVTRGEEPDGLHGG
jgi:hypothetical protein